MEFFKKEICPFCRNNPSTLNSREIGWPLIETPDKHDPMVWIVADTLITASPENYGSRLGCPIQYCPICGRYLGGEKHEIKR